MNAFFKLSSTTATRQESGLSFLTGRLRLANVRVNKKFIELKVKKNNI
jgi:hypothetical protein